MCLLKNEKRIILKSGLFDEKYYLLNNPDVRIADTDALKHFMAIGWKEGRNPSTQFDLSFYLMRNPDVREAGINPLLHYIRYGKSEGRATLPRQVMSHRILTNTLKSEPKNIFTLANFRFALRYIRLYGFRQFWLKAKNKLVGEKEGSINLDQNPLTIQHVSPIVSRATFTSEIEIELFEKSVSVIIPTKNAGKDFPILMKTLNAQRGFEKIEVVVVDSGSTDETLETAKLLGATVINIKPEDFSHSGARNLGAKAASGDYLLFIVQDALPPNDTWLATMYMTLIENDLAVVSCAETPREDADLFYRQNCWNYYNFLGVNNTDRIFSLPKSQDYVSLRQNGQLSDLANFISRDIFMQYGYRLNYAEDLDLGIRLIKDGHTLAFLGSSRVIHSHNRTPYYFLKRGFVDNIFLSDIFDDFVIPHIQLKELIPDLVSALIFLSQLNSSLDSLSTPVNLEDLENLVLRSIDWGTGKKSISSTSIFVESKFDDNAIKFFERLIEGFDLKNNRIIENGIMHRAFRGHAQVVLDYIKNSYEIVDETLIEEVKVCFTKAFSIILGSFLAFCYKNRDETDSEEMKSLYSTMMEGV